MVDCACPTGLGSRHSCNVDFPLHSCQVADCLAEDFYSEGLTRLRLHSTPIRLSSLPSILNGCCSLVASIVSMSSGETNEHCAVINRSFAYSANHHAKSPIQAHPETVPGFCSPIPRLCPLGPMYIARRLDTLDSPGSDAQLSSTFPLWGWV